MIFILFSYLFISFIHDIGHQPFTQKYIQYKKNNYYYRIHGVYCYIILSRAERKLVWTVTYTYHYRPWTSSIKPSLQHFRFCCVRLYLRIPIFPLFWQLYEIANDRRAWLFIHFYKYKIWFIALLSVICCFPAKWNIILSGNLILNR